MKSKREIPIHSLEKSYKSFLIRPLNKQIKKKTNDQGPHRHKYHEILYLKSGIGEHIIDDKLIKLEPHTIYCIGLNQIHGFDYGKNLDGYLVRFEAEFLPIVNDSSDILSSYEQNTFLKNILNLQAVDIQNFELLFSLILNEYNNQNEGNRLTIQNLIFALLNKISHCLQLNIKHSLNLIDDQDKRLYNEFMIMANDNFKAQHTLSYYSKNMGLSNRRLSDICRKYSGKTGKVILLEKLISEIKRFLKYSSLSVKEIAYRLHFEDPAYMSRLYKRLTGDSLTSYRRRG